MEVDLDLPFRDGKDGWAEPEGDLDHALFELAIAREEILRLRQERDALLEEKGGSDASSGL